MELTLTNLNTKAAVAAKAAEITAAVKDGEADALGAWVALKAVENCVKQAQKDIERNALSAAMLYGARQFEAFGASVQVKEGGVRMDYADCGDREYDDLCDRINALLARKKELEAILAAHKERWVKTDTDTGEVYEVLPPVRTAKETLAVTLK